MPFTYTQLWAQLFINKNLIWRSYKELFSLCIFACTSVTKDMCLIHFPCPCSPARKHFLSSPLLHLQASRFLRASGSSRAAHCSQGCLTPARSVSLASCLPSHPVLKPSVNSMAKAIKDPRAKVVIYLTLSDSNVIPSVTKRRCFSPPPARSSI